MLPAALDQLWNAYLRAEARATRAEKLTRLEAFLSQFLDAPPDLQSSWACEIARQKVDGGADIPIRMPLFRFAIFPALREAIAHRVPGAARWLAGMSQELYRAKDCQQQLPANCQTKIGLLYVALEHDPSDKLSLERLVPALAWHLEYSIHEVPSGVLYGYDGATIEQCDELQSELETFRHRAMQAGMSEKYRHLIDECAFHFEHYPRYLASMREYGSYAQYLKCVKS